ncbi:MarR family winged helix-turn-helix transcriptional regulator [Salidesulfovibrio brasiliensis]|uniref:MarR family winged helix-turn-helix transcriptional regulator n=1 Tax=Salidesulfovibrio brasiliensis TaxID=221711 RepID=UPI0006D0398B|nr:MarR family transcriptional regulator [Salidesulfovibrio brasiliensis]
MFFLKELPTREILERYHERFPEMNVDMVGDALLLMRQASLLLRQLDEYFSGHDFSQLRFLIIVIIDREQETLLTASEILKKLDVSGPVMARTLKALEASQMIVFHEHESDKRAKRIALTPKGKAKLQAILPGYYETIERFMSTLGQHDAS